MTVAATIHCKLCHAVYALFSDTVFSHGDKAKNCDICGHVIARWSHCRMPLIQFVRLDLPATGTE
jgi:hypothetical protein